MSVFKYYLSGGLRTDTKMTPEGKIKFNPPVYEQRYTTVVRIIEDPTWKQSLKKIVDFGCAEIQLLQLLRRIPFVEHILEVDINGPLLEVYQQRAIPLISDHLQKREKPLRVEILEGSMIDPVEQLYDVDVVIALEIIEHLHADVLEKVPENVFGFIQPKLAIFSTPNSEFNVLFDSLLENGFRHYDHKFEWTRDEFKKWALDICQRYPNYSVAFKGVGEAPSKEETRALGFSTQIAIFARNDMINMPLKEEVIKNPLLNSEAKYRTVYAVDFPFNKDERSREQQLLDETHYYIYHSRYVPRFFNRERMIYQLPWRNILKDPACKGFSEQELLDVLKSNGFNVENDFIILPEYDEETGADDNDADINDEFYPNESDDELSHLASGCINFNQSVPSCNDCEEDWD